MQPTPHDTSTSAAPNEPLGRRTKKRGIVENIIIQAVAAELFRTNSWVFSVESLVGVAVGLLPAPDSVKRDRRREHALRALEGFVARGELVIRADGKLLVGRLYEAERPTDDSVKRDAAIDECVEALRGLNLARVGTKAKTKTEIVDTVIKVAELALRNLKTGVK